MPGLSSEPFRALFSLEVLILLTEAIWSEQERVNAGSREHFLPKRHLSWLSWSFAHHCSESILLLVCEQGIHTLRRKKLKPRIDVNTEVATDFLPLLSFSHQSQRGHTWPGPGLGGPVLALFPLPCKGSQASGGPRIPFWQREAMPTGMLRKGQAKSTKDRRCMVFLCDSEQMAFSCKFQGFFSSTDLENLLKN